VVGHRAKMHGTGAGSESRFQRWRFQILRILGRSPQAQDECPTFGANHFERRGFALSRLVNLG
jgi:hypothetical protein